MKTIGRTNEGNYLVEMNPDEHRALAGLAGVGEEWTSIEPYYNDPATAFIDLSTPIGAVRHYARSRARLSELQRLLNDIKDTYRNEKAEYDEGD